jgi:hypothetical protein
VHRTPSISDSDPSCPSRNLPRHRRGARTICGVVTARPRDARRTHDVSRGRSP